MATGAARADREHWIIHGSDRAAAGADRFDTRHRQVQREVAHHAAVGDQRLRVAHQRQIGAGAAHIHGEQHGRSAAAMRAQAVTPEAGPESSVCTRRCASFGRRHHAAIGPGDEQARVFEVLLQIALEYG